MIKVGQVRMLKNHPEVRIVITWISNNSKLGKYREITYINNVGISSISFSRHVSSHYKTIAEYPTWQEAVNSKEFKE